MELNHWFSVLFFSDLVDLINFDGTLKIIFTAYNSYYYFLYNLITFDFIEGFVDNSSKYLNHG